MAERKDRRLLLTTTSNHQQRHVTKLELGKDADKLRHLPDTGKFSVELLFCCSDQSPVLGDAPLAGGGCGAFPSERPGPLRWVQFLSAAPPMLGTRGRVSDGWLLKDRGGHFDERLQTP